MAKGSLGPFPKTRRWREIFGGHLDLTSTQSELLADHSLCRLKATLEDLLGDPEAIKAVLFWVALPIATRSQDPAAELRHLFGIIVQSDERSHLVEGLRQYVPTESPIRAAAEATLLGASAEASLLPKKPWEGWRIYDGPEFCNLAYRFYSNLNRELFGSIAPEAPIEAINTFAAEMAVITRAFSARWFNACARSETPSRNSVRWYFAHCLGKLDLELSREMSDWVEKPKRKKGEPEPTLDLYP